ncbi:MAG: thermonuclease family protein [Hyphomicrobiaceae bacterium]|nr:thermonuclease family protein [Hyphomicrobiaceae bacterium]
MTHVWLGALLLVASLFFAPTTHAQPIQFEMCVRGQQRSGTETCIVDGDTLWLNGVNIRLKDFDTPEPQTAICGGQAEVDLAGQASARLLQLLNSNDWTIEYFGMDNGGNRRLATIRIGGRDVGDILISERLARHWPDGDEWWCD